MTENVAQQYKKIKQKKKTMKTIQLTVAIAGNVSIS